MTEVASLPPSSKCVLRELEHADEPLSRREIADRTRLSYSTTYDGVQYLREAELIGVSPIDDRMFFFVLAGTFRDS